MANRTFVSALLLAQALVAYAGAAEPPVVAEIVDVTKIWDRAPHCAFTDLVRFKDQWYCAFREGQRHVDPHGKLRVIRSADGKAWESAGLLEHAEYDLRDACLSETPDGRLMLLGGAQKVRDGQHPTGTVVSFSDDGATWSAPKLVLPLPQWLWRVTWHEGKAYGMSYGSEHGQKHYALQTTADGLNYEPITMDAPAPHGGGWLTEARIRFDEDGAAYCLQRRDGQENSALLGVATPPYLSWDWKDLGVYFGGPNFIKTPAGHWIGAGRIIGDSPHTDVTWVDVKNGVMKSLARLPSGGDCSYPGMVWHDGLLWLSYYSSHEGRTSIYLAKVRITPK
ncbi:MAG TPA: sialidase family protein [Lacipirellula sp.]